MLGIPRKEVLGLPLSGGHGGGLGGMHGLGQPSLGPWSTEGTLQSPASWCLLGGSESLGTAKEVLGTKEVLGNDDPGNS